MASLYETAARLHDPRVRGRSKHLLADIVILAVLAVTSGAEGYEAIEEFGKYHYQTLKKRLRLPENREENQNAAAFHYAAAFGVQAFLSLPRRYTAQ